ncbi:hypothetical protein CYLTODRAFT_357845 [Cylindrobasidium torrendii FP15055 ss-10]|uniref:Pre-mRNA-splicing factor CWC26 n=1 Tax=Cylindrobasidium torrendii FP15055 ss-10 TaxID=1314674 RepID=A0A0D7B3Q5_9AGAR|nr:hypothetical protein CYLTODRAFT_357845 [Cylindrobasidium torrendii FP15055 ss-10]
MSDLKSYLAEKYMSGPKADAILAKTAPKKKKKRKVQEAGGSSSGFIKDDDTAWTAPKEEDEEMDVSEAIVASDRTFKKRKREGEAASGWSIVKEPTPPPEDEKPQLVETDTPFTGGLVSAKQLKKALPQVQSTTRATDEDFTAEEIAAAQETVYRDATGRKIDTKAAKAEAAKKKREREEKEAQKKDWGRGVVQRDEQKQRQKELEKQRMAKGFRNANDADLNEDLKAKELWNDPAAAFLTKKSKSKGPRLPEYSGPTPPPNRFNIKPGYRWDGVDRSNGFEAKYFQQQNVRKRTTHEGHMWSTEDM